MKKFFVVVLMVSIVIISVSAHAASLHDYPTVGILPYVNKAAISAELSIADASIVSDIVLEKLVDSGRFTVVERERNLVESSMKILSCKLEISWVHLIWLQEVSRDLAQRKVV